MKIFDAHNHLQAPELAPHLDGIIATREAERMVVNGTCEADWPAVERLAAEHTWVRPSYGVHPWEVDGVSSRWLETLSAFLDRGGFVGEIGLDRWKTDANFARQREVFRAQWREGARRGRPITVHCLRAWGPLVEELRELPRADFLIHAYGGPREMVGEFARLGAYFSFSGSFLAAGREKKRAAFLEVPADRLLVETDAPSMALPRELARVPLPPDASGQPVNHPGNLAVAYEGLAALRGVPLDQLAAVVAENYARLFGD